jgi:3-oxoadipate enol-lactonase
MWAPQLGALGGWFRLAALDRRGFGSSTARPGLGQEADDVARALDQLGMARATIVGMSQAGRVALDFALRFPDRLDALVLQGAPLGGVTPGPEPDETIPIVEYSALVRAGRLDEMKRRWRTHALMRTMSPEAARAAEEMVRDYVGRDLGAASDLRDAEPQDLARISAPALVITGAQDTPWRRRSGDALAKALANARRVEIESAGHLCNLCRPDAYNSALRNFVLEAAGCAA